MEVASMEALTEASAEAPTLPWKLPFLPRRLPYLPRKLPWKLSRSYTKNADSAGGPQVIVKFQSSGYTQVGTYRGAS